MFKKDNIGANIGANNIELSENGLNNAEEDDILINNIDKLDQQPLTNFIIFYKIQYNLGK